MEFKEFKIQGHWFRWSIIDTLSIESGTYALMESSIGDEAPLILIRYDQDKIKEKRFFDLRPERKDETIVLGFIPSELVIDYEVYDDIVIALGDNDLLTEEEYETL